MNLALLCSAGGWSENLGVHVVKRSFEKKSFDFTPGKMFTPFSSHFPSALWPSMHALNNFPGNPSFIYSWSISHILEQEFFCLGHFGQLRAIKKSMDIFLVTF